MLKCFLPDRGPGSLKMNNSVFQVKEYQERIRNTIQDTANNNKDTTPNILLEVIKGSIRNEIIKHSSKQHNLKLPQENELISLILKLEQEFINGPENTELQKSW